MQRGLSTHMFVTQRLTTAILDRIARSSIRRLEIFCARQHMDYRDRNQIADLAAWFSGSEVKLNSLHLPMYRDDAWGKSGPDARISITETERPRRMEALDDLKRALEIAETIPFTYAILHVGPGGDTYDGRKFDAALASIEHLHPFAKHRNVTLLLENTPSEMSTPDRLHKLIHELGLSNIGLCFDSGHAHMTGDALGVWEKMQPLVRSTHLHDNHGEKDEHLFPFEGSIDWKALGSAMADSKSDFPWMLEIHDPSGVADPVTHSPGLFDRLEETIHS